MVEVAGAGGGAVVPAAPVVSGIVVFVAVVCGSQEQWAGGQ